MTFELGLRERGGDVGRTLWEEGTALAKIERWDFAGIMLSHSGEAGT